MKKFSAVLNGVESAERLIINFHGLGAIPAGVEAAEAHYWCTCEAFLSTLEAMGPLSEEAKVPIDITFDDGNMSDARIALPALMARGMRATFFVCAGRIGQPGYLDVPALRELDAAGMSIGSHGWNHVDWRRADDKTLSNETAGALAEISSVIGQVVDEVGVPFGSYDRRVLNRLRRAGVRTAFTSDRGRCPIDAWLAPRYSYNKTWNEETLRDAVINSAGIWVRAKGSMTRMLKQMR